jgi:hypothetical protein
LSLEIYWTTVKHTVKWQPWEYSDR